MPTSIGVPMASYLPLNYHLKIGSDQSDSRLIRTGT